MREDYFDFLAPPFLGGAFFEACSACAAGAGAGAVGAGIGAAAVVPSVDLFRLNFSQEKSPMGVPRALRKN